MLLKYIFLVCLGACVASLEIQGSEKGVRALKNQSEQIPTILANFDAQYEWNMYKTKYNKKYDSFEEDQKRLNIFTENMKRILEHNDRYDKGLVSYGIGINQFSDWTEEERKKPSGLGPINKEKNKIRINTPPSGFVATNEEDWRKDGAVSAVGLKSEARALKNQSEQIPAILANFDAQYEWNMYKTKYNKKYDSFEEDQKRLNIFTENMKRILEHNDRYDKGLVSYGIGINQFSDWTEEERKKPSGLGPINKEKNKIRVNTPPSGFVATNEEDWRKDGAVSAVGLKSEARPLKNQREQLRRKLIKSTILANFDALRYEWNMFKTKYNKKYDSFEEDLKRLNIFTENMKRILEHNDRYNKGVVTYSVGMNKFGDWTEEEFKKLRGLQPINKEENKIHVYTPPSGFVATNEVDWRKDGAVTAVKEQGECRSAWAFSAAGAIEGQYFRETKTLVDLSAQNLIDCSRGFGNVGCGGGSVEAAFKYVEENGGIDTELGYPYEGYNAPECRYTFKYAGATVDGYESIPENEEILASAVAFKGPISAAVDADGFGFHFYKKGIYYNESCSWEYEKLNHAVLIIGYGNATASDFWNVKNSWGEDWGEGGYMRLARNRENNCGIATNTLVPRILPRPESNDD